MKMFYVVSYDIPDDRRRIHVAKTLLDFGVRVQYSVFECIMDNNARQELLQRLAKIIVADEDKIRVYALCARCEGGIAVLGSGEVTKDKDIYVL
ncbi:MAG: CRISPR-associated endonuclease Cas2 [Syntrophales bacterium]